jgi:uncharacterized protein
MLDLPLEQLKMVQAILQEHIPEFEVWAFGSRIKGTVKIYSDLDLVIRGQTRLPARRRNLLEEAFQESTLPIRVDLLEWCEISSSFQKVIEKAYVVLQPGTVDCVTDNDK